MELSRGMEFITTFPIIRLIATSNPDKDGRFVAIERDGTHHILNLIDVKEVLHRVWPEELD